VKSSELAVL